MAFDLEQLVDLALFARVVELRSFTSAAAQSGIAKSAVSRRITLLERRLGVQLLRRSTRRLALTREGARFYEHCAKLLGNARAAEESVATAGQAVRGSLRISAPVTFSQMHLTAALAAFLTQYPETEIQLVADDHLVDVVEGGFDLVIRIARLASASFVARRLATDRLVVCGAPTYLAAHGRPQTPEELVHHNCLHYELVSRAGEWRFRTSRGREAVPTRGNFSATDGTVLRQAALAGTGLVVLPFFMVAPDVAAGRLELVLDAARRAQIGIYGVVAKAQGLPLRTRTLLDFLVRWFAHVDWERPGTSRVGRAVSRRTR
jgi:DNA-binding transcriptional LysR family regulator